MAHHVLVTGAAGFIAAHTLADLLARGHRVRGTVRSLGKQDAYAHLTALPGAADRLELVEANLLDASGFVAAVQGVDAVMHIASPYVIDVADPRRDLVEPAVTGTRNVLEAAAGSPAVRRVVLTSSMAAITDEPETDHVLTEADWNLKSSLTRNPYYYSKTMAERAAWDFMAEKKPGFDLVVVNPFMVIGPSLSSALNTSNKVFVDMAKGVYPGIMELAWGFVDVRDVARAHVLALETSAASGRYLCSGDVLSMREVVEVLGRVLPGRRLPSLPLDNAFGTALMRLASYSQSKGTGSYLRSNLGRRICYDAGKIQRELGLAFRPARDSITDTAIDLVKWGHIKE